MMSDNKKFFFVNEIIFNEIRFAKNILREFITAELEGHATLMKKINI